MTKCRSHVIEEHVRLTDKTHSYSVILDSIKQNNNIPSLPIMNARNLESRILIVVQPPHPVRFAAVFLGNRNLKFFSAPICPNPDSSGNRESEFLRFTQWMKSFKSSGFAAWGTEMMAFLEGYLRCHFAGGWFDLSAFVDGMDGSSTKTLSIFWTSGLETLLEEQANRALALVSLCEIRQTILSHPPKLPSLAALRY